MYEIELKARIASIAETEAQVRTFAEFLGSCDKHDTYWTRTITGQPEQRISIRIREETRGGDVRCAVTYKRKETRRSNDGAAYEVNDEQEFHIDSRTAFEAFLRDDGFAPEFCKHKRARQWKTDTVLIELCDVERLGAFIELEILSDGAGAQRVTDAVSELHTVLARCGVSCSAVEARYYSELLREAEQGEQHV